MNRQLPIIFSLFFVSSFMLQAQQAVESLNPDSSTVLSAQAKPTDTPPDSGMLVPKKNFSVQPHSDIVSSSTSALVIGGLPKYSPPKPPVPEKTLAEEFPDLREVDKPQNKIIRLPRYMVHAPKSPILSDKEVLTDAQKTALAMKKYAGLGLGLVPLLNGAVAKQFYQQDERLQNIAELKDLAGAVRSGGDVKESEYIKRQSQDTYMNGINWGGTIPKP